VPKLYDLSIYNFGLSAAQVQSRYIAEVGKFKICQQLFQSLSFLRI
jgi:hypothetical protein